MNGTCVPIDACASNPCTGGKQCTSRAGIASCACAADQLDVGGQCVSAACAAANCGAVPHQTVCTVNNGVATCSCEAGWLPGPNGGCMPMQAPDCSTQHGGDAQEPDECPSLAGSLVAGLTQQHTLAPAGDVDWYQFRPTAGHVVEVSVADLAGGSMLDVFRADAVTPLAVDHSGLSPVVRFVVPSTNASPLYARVSSATGGGNDVYEVTLQDLGVDDLPDSLASAQPLGNGARFEGDVQFDGDLDVARLDTTAGDAWSLSLDSVSEVDLEVLSSSGVVLQRLGYAGASATVVATDTALYLRARARYTGSTGAFSVGVTALGADDFGDDALHATPITADGTTRSARWERSTDVDTFSFQSIAGHSYTLACASSSAGCRVTTTFANGTVSTASGLSALNTTLNPTTTGTVILAFSSYASGTGPYTFAVNDLSVDDVGDDMTTASPLTLGTTRSAALQTTTDHDVFSLSVTSGTLYSVTCTSSATYLCAMVVRTAAGGTLTSTSYGYGSPTTVSFSAASTGTVYIDVYGSSSTGSYTVQAIDTGSDDFGDTAATATTITLGSTTNGNVQFNGDLDVFAFTAAADAIFSVRCTTTASYGCAMVVRDPNGLSVTSTSYGTNVQTWFKATTAGRYTVQVGASYTGYFGAYALTVSNSGTDDFGDTAAAASPITIGVNVNGTTQFAYDHDVFSATVTAGHVYSVTCTTTVSYLCALVVRNDAGTSLATTSYGSSTTLSFVPAASGTITIDHAPASTSTGAFTLRITDTGTDDFADTWSSATSGTVGSAISGSTQFSGDKDVIAFTTTASHLYSVSCTGSQTYGCTLTMRDNTGILVASSSYGTSVTLPFKALSAGPYTVEVRNTYTYTGTWTLTVSDIGTDDHGDTAATGTTVTVGSTATTGTLQFSGDKDVFVFTATAGTLYRFSCTTGASYLCALSAKNPSGTVVTSSSYGTNTSVGFKAATSGTFSVEVSSTYSYQGVYSVQLSTLTDDHGDTPGAATSISLGQTRTGNLDYAADVDYFAVTLTAGTAYTVTLAPSTVGFTVIDPTLGTVTSSAGGFTAASSGTYYVRVAATASTQVPYSVLVQ